MLTTNRTKVCFWHREFAGLYLLGDIVVEQIWHTKGVCANSWMWHVKIGGNTIVTWAYLKDAKRSAHLINKAVEGPRADQALIDINDEKYKKRFEKWDI